MAPCTHAWHTYSPHTNTKDQVGQLTATASLIASIRALSNPIAHLVARDTLTSTTKTCA